MYKPSPTGRPLNGYALTNHFRKLRLRESFSPLEAYLFFELVAICNDEGWPTEFNASNGVIQAALGCSEQGLIKARQRLKKAGLIVFISGNRRTPTSYQLMGKGSTELSLSAYKGSTEDSTQFSLSAVESNNGLTEGSTQGLTEFSPYIKEIETKKEIEGNAASAATPSLSFSVEQSEKPKPTTRSKKSAARSEEIAALVLTHPGSKFAELWAAFLTSPKQAKKPVTAFELMLTKLGKYPEGFAIVMLEDAIQGDWQGIENGGTAEKYAKWRAAEVERAHRQPVRTNSATNDDPDLNHEFIAEVAARRQKEEDDHFARHQVKPEPPTSFNPDELFGYNQPASVGIAQAQATPEYQQYLAELAAQQQASAPAPATDAAQEPANDQPTTAPEPAQATP